MFAHGAEQHPSAPGVSTPFSFFSPKFLPVRINSEMKFFDNPKRNTMKLKTWNSTTWLFLTEARPDPGKFNKCQHVRVINEGQFGYLFHLIVFLPPSQILNGRRNPRKGTYETSNVESLLQGATWPYSAMFILHSSIESRPCCFKIRRV